jgi:hypothetical protein
MKLKNTTPMYRKYLMELLQVASKYRFWCMDILQEREKGTVDYELAEDSSAEYFRIIKKLKEIDSREK